MAPIERDRRFNMHLSEEEDRMLRELADASGISASDYLRLMIRNDHGKLASPRNAAARMFEADRKRLEEQLHSAGLGPRPKRR